MLKRTFKYKNKDYDYANFKEALDIIKLVEEKETSGWWIFKKTKTTFRKPTEEEILNRAISIIKKQDPDIENWPPIEAQKFINEWIGVKEI